MTDLTSSSPRDAGAAVSGWRAYVLVAIIALLSSTFGIAQVQVMDVDEARFAQASRQMIESNDYVNIRLQDRERNRKPAGLYWLQAASAQAFEPLTGSLNQIWPYRIPSALGVVLAALATFWAGSALLGPRTALLGASLMAAGILVGFEGMTAKTDALLLGFTTLALAALARLYAQHPTLSLAERVAAKRRGEGRSDKQAPEQLNAPHPLTPSPQGRRGRALALLFWFALGCGVLIKGPITPLVAGLTLITLALLDRRAAWMKPLAWWPGPLIALLIVLPWAIAIGVATEGRFYTAILETELGPKVAGNDRGHGGIFGYYVLLLPLLLFPATYAFPAVARLLREKTQTDIAPNAARFLIAWAAPTFLAFELIPAKLVHYTMPVYPALALLCGAGIATAADHNWRWTHRIGVALFALVGALFAAAIAFGLLEIPVSQSQAVSAGILIGLIVVAGTIAAAFTPSAATRTAALVVCALAFSFSVRSVIAPRVDALHVSASAAEALFQSLPHAASENTPLWIVGYDEPSLIFLTRTSAHIVEPEELAEAQAGDAMIVESRALGAVHQTLTAHDLVFVAAAPPARGMSMSASDMVELYVGTLSTSTGAVVSASRAPITAQRR